MTPVTRRHLGRQANNETVRHEEDKENGAVNTAGVKRPHEDGAREHGVKYLFGPRSSDCKDRSA